MTWTQSCCDPCWNTQAPDRLPVRVVDPETKKPTVLERCSFCGSYTQSGIYVRADPRTVPYPREERG